MIFEPQIRIEPTMQRSDLTLSDGVIFVTSLQYDNGDLIAGEISEMTSISLEQFNINNASVDHYIALTNQVITSSGNFRSGFFDEFLTELKIIENGNVCVKVERDSGIFFEAEFIKSTLMVEIHAREEVTVKWYEFLLYEDSIRNFNRVSNSNC